MAKRGTLWVDRAKSKTVADIATVEECDAYINQAQRDIKSMELGSIIDNRTQTALHYRRLVINGLNQRRQLLANSPK